MKNKIEYEELLFILEIIYIHLYVTLAIEYSRVMEQHSWRQSLAKWTCVPYGPLGHLGPLVLQVVEAENARNPDYVPKIMNLHTAARVGSGVGNFGFEKGKAKGFNILRFSLVVKNGRNCILVPCNQRFSGLIQPLGH